MPLGQSRIKESSPANLDLTLTSSSPASAVLKSLEPKPGVGIEQGLQAQLKTVLESPRSTLYLGEFLSS